LIREVTDGELAADWRQFAESVATGLAESEGGAVAVSVGAGLDGGAEAVADGELAGLDEDGVGPGEGDGCP
jgi:hypothetical protein